MNKLIAIVIVLVALQPVKSVHGTVNVNRNGKMTVIVDGGTIAVDELPGIRPGDEVLVSYLGNNIVNVKEVTR